MTKFTTGHMRIVALVLKSEMPDRTDDYYGDINHDFVADVENWCNMCQAFAIRFKQNNSNFAVLKFYTQCGIIDRDRLLRMVQI